MRQLALAMLLLASAPGLNAADGPADSLDGTWTATAAELAGTPFPEEVRKSITLVLKGDQYTVTVGTQADRGTVTFNPKAQPKTLDITGTEGPNKGKTLLAIYERQGKTLRICYDLGGKNRPTEFATKAGTQLFLVSYELQAE
jgi:uncharacterized protein (TIGR03067 family)